MNKITINGFEYRTDLDKTYSDIYLTCAMHGDPNFAHNGTRYKVISKIDAGLIIRSEDNELFIVSKKNKAL